jgi:hypothetical protein
VAGPFIPAGGADLPFGQSAFGGSHDQSIGAFLYRLIFGPTSRPGDGSAHATAEGFNPLSRGGAANDLSMLFGGGPKGDASSMMGDLGMPGQFRDYGGADVNPLARGIAHEGPNPGARGAGIRGLVRRAQGTGSHQVDPIRSMSERMNAIAKQEENHQAAAAEQQRQAFLKREAFRRVQLRNKVNDRLNAEPMTPGQALHRSGSNPAEHDYFDGPEFDHLVNRGGHGDPRIELLHRLAARRYQAQMGHNHQN